MNDIFDSKAKHYGKGIISVLILPVLFGILPFDVRAEEPIVNQQTTSSTRSHSVAQVKLPTPEEREQALEDLPVNEQEYRIAKAQFEVGHPQGTLQG